jgi:hypothetical protein
VLEQKREIISDKTQRHEQDSPFREGGGGKVAQNFAVPQRKFVKLRESKPFLSEIKQN